MNAPENLPDSPSDFLIYQTEDGRTRVEARMVNETVWGSLGQMAALFPQDKSVIAKHVRNIFPEGELTPQATVAKFATVQSDGARSVRQ
jgi:hypothetical protein